MNDENLNNYPYPLVNDDYFLAAIHGRAISYLPPIEYKDKKTFLRLYEQIEMSKPD